MNILVHNTNIIAVNPVDTGDQWETSDQIIPKNVAAGAVIVDATLPSDYAPGKYIYSAGVFTLKPVVVTAEQKAAANASIMAKLAANDLTIVRALVENDTVRMAVFKTSQAALRAQLV